MFVCGLAGVGLGFWLGIDFPDLDINLLGIAYHRNPLFHSVLVPFLAWRGVEWIRQRLPEPILDVALLFVAGFTAGVGTHLGFDAFRDVGGTIRGPVMAALKLFLMTAFGLGPAWINAGFLILNLALCALLVGRVLHNRHAGGPDPVDAGENEPSATGGAGPTDGQPCPRPPPPGGELVRRRRSRRRSIRRRRVVVVH